MTLNEAKYINRIERGTAAARAIGENDKPTVLDMLLHFWSQPGINAHPSEADYLRQRFHDVMHGYAGYLYASVKGEERVAIYEAVFMRGRYNDLNDTDQSLYGEIAPAKDQQWIERFLKRRVEATNRRTSPDYERNYKYVTDIEFSHIYKQAVEDEAFFRDLSGGRALYQLSNAELTRLPLVCLGLTLRSGPGFVVDKMPHCQRQKILDRLDCDDAHLHLKMNDAARATRSDAFDFMPTASAPTVPRFVI